MKIYISAPLFNKVELEHNRSMRDSLMKLGFKTYLPQEDGSIAFNAIKQGANIAETRRNIFNNNVKEIKNNDIVLCILDGRVPDEGVCVELGIAYALGKICIGYLTDQRSLDLYGPNLMIGESLKVIAHSMRELKEVLLKYSRK